MEPAVYCSSLALASLARAAVPSALALEGSRILRLEPASAALRTRVPSRARVLRRLCRATDPASLRGCATTGAAAPSSNSAPTAALSPPGCCGLPGWTTRRPSSTPPRSLRCQVGIHGRWGDGSVRTGRGTRRSRATNEHRSRALETCPPACKASRGENETTFSARSKWPAWPWAGQHAELQVRGQRRPGLHSRLWLAALCKCRN